MAFELTKEQRWEIFNNLPESLKDAIFSEDTADAIWNICKLHNVDSISEVAKIVGNALMGLLPPEKMESALTEKMGLDQSTAKAVAVEVQHYIFNPVADDLLSLYSPDKIKELEKTSETEVTQPASKGKNIYREEITE